MIKPSVPTISILASGTYTDASGRVVPLTTADLGDIVSSYDPISDPAPIVIGKPKLDDPAYGWVKSLSMADGRVRASVEHLEPSFAETVREGRYSDVSASLYMPDSPSNPKPGRWYLRHIGFQGIAAPSIKGLDRVSFAAPTRDTTVSLPAAVPHGVMKTRFNLPCGRSMECDSFELAARITAVREAHHLSFADACMVAFLDVALSDATVCFAAPDPQSDDWRRAISYRMKRAVLLDPSISFSEALERAEAEHKRRY